MRIRGFVVVIAALSFVANIVFGVGPVLALAVAVATLGFGEVIGLLLGGYQTRRNQAVAIAPANVAAASDAFPLSRRESDVARLVAMGLTNKQIAQRLFLAERTVDNHVQHCLNKLALENRTQLAVWARDHGLLDQGEPQPR